MKTEQPKISIRKVIGKGYNRFWNNKQFYRVVKGSRGSKKSKTTALNFIHRIMKYPWANLLVVRRYSNTNKQSTYTDLKWAASMLGVAHLFKFNESLPEITYRPTGQKILFRGLDDELKITSITVDVGILCWSWFEEAYQIETEEKFRTVVESIRGMYETPDFFKQITVTFNPWSERHWLKKVFFDEATREKDTFAITTTFRVNEWLDEVDRSRYLDLYRTNPRRARIVADGDWGVAEGLVFENFEVKDFNIQQKIKEVQETAHGMDFGFTNDPTTVVSSIVDLENKELWIYDEHYEKAMLTSDIYEMLGNKGLNETPITADSAEKRLIQELINKGTRRMRGSVKGPAALIKAFFLYRDSKCISTLDVYTVEEFNTYTFDQDKEGKWLNTPTDANNHIIDALRYSLEEYHLGIEKITNTYKALQNSGL